MPARQIRVELQRPSVDPRIAVLLFGVSLTAMTRSRVGCPACAFRSLETLRTNWPCSVKSRRVV